MAQAGRTLDWTGGSLDELIQLLSEPALSARVEARQHDGIGERAVGEVHVVAGGFSDAYSGIERGEAALAKLRKMQDLRYRVEPRLPHPVTGNLSPPGLEEGTLAERPLTELMRYCEDFVLTCTVEVWHRDQNARVSYRRGELVKTTVNGADAPEKLPDVLAWPEGHYRFVLPQLTLPPGPAESASSTPALGMLWADQPSAPAPTAIPTDVAAPLPMAVAPAEAARPAAAARTGASPAPAPDAGVKAPAARPKRGGTPGPRSTIPFMPSNEATSPVRGTNQGMQVDVYDPPQAVRSTDVGVPAITAPTPDTKTTLPGPSHDKAAKAGSGKDAKDGGSSRDGRDSQDRKDSKKDSRQDRPRAADTLHEVEPSVRSTAPGFASAGRPPSSDASTPAPAEAKADKHAKRDKADKADKTDKTDRKRKGASAQPQPAVARGGVAARKPTGLYALPLGVHVVLGLLFGALIVGGYWVLQKYGVLPPGR